MTELFSVSVDRDNDLATMVIAGEVDLAAIERLEAARAGAVDSGARRMLIDLSDVSFIDSSGLKFLLETHKLAEASGWTLSLTRPRESAMHAFRLTGTDLRLPFAD